MDQLLYVALGSVSESWGREGTNIIRTSEIINLIYRHVAEAYKKHELSQIPNWLYMLAKQSSCLSNSKGPERDFLLRLVNLGRGRAKKFLAEGGHPDPLFGISDCSVFIPILRKSDYRISLLRKMAQKLFPQARACDIIIQYLPEEIAGPKAPAAGNDLNQDTLQTTQGQPISKREKADADSFTEQEHTSGPEIRVFESDLTSSYSGTHGRYYCTALPLVNGSPFIAHQTAAAQDLLYHQRWGNKLRYDNSDTADKDIFLGKKLHEEIDHWPSDVTSILPEEKVWNFKDQGSNPFIRALVKKLVENENSKDDTLETNGEGNSVPTSYKLCLGTVGTAAMFVATEVLDDFKKSSRQPYWISQKVPPSRRVSCEDVEAASNADAIDGTELRNALKRIISSSEYSAYFLSLSTLASIEEVYKELGDATISPIITTNPLSSAKWLSRKADSFWAFRMTREETFACITYLESGLNLHLSTFKGVMALSSADSIFVSRELLCDPLNQPSSGSVRRVIGNLGKPGVSLLIPPPNPLCLEPDPGSWKVINREYFKGELTNNFTGTTLHLSFTDWRTPIDVGQSAQGHRNVEAYIYEALVSVHDHGRWIADLDIIDALGKGCGSWDHQWFYKSGCTHSPHTDDPDPFNLCNSDQIVCIQNWDEFLDHPTGPAILMAHENWLARLAAAALAVRRHDRVIVSDRMCWDCYKDLATLGGPEIMGKTLWIC